MKKDRNFPPLTAKQRNYIQLLAKAGDFESADEAIQTVASVGRNLHPGTNPAYVTRAVRDGRYELDKLNMRDASKLIAALRAAVVYGDLDLGIDRSDIGDRLRMAKQFYNPEDPKPVPPSLTFKRYHRGSVPDSRDVPNLDESEGYRFHCPKCDFEFVHPVGVRMVEGPYDGRLCAEIALNCENGCETTLIFGNHTGWGYCHWVDDTDAKPMEIGGDAEVLRWERPGFSHQPMNPDPR